MAASIHGHTQQRDALANINEFVLHDDIRESKRSESLAKSQSRDDPEQKNSGEKIQASIQCLAAGVLTEVCIAWIVGLVNARPMCGMWCQV
jgi:hypothetical protein